MIGGREDKHTGFTGIREEFYAWRTGAVRLLKNLLGIGIIEEENAGRCTRTPETERTEQVLLEGGIVRERRILYTEDDVCMPFYVLIPPGADRHTRPFLCPPAHGGNGKSSTAGLCEYPGVRERIRRYGCDYGLQLAHMGHAAICPDIRGSGERRELASAWQERNGGPDPFSGDCAMLARMGEPLGIPAAGMLTWDLMRLTDWVIGHGKQQGIWDPDAVSGLGFSGGGMQILFLSALDERIRLSVISGYLYGCRDSLLQQSWNCSCNYVPHLWEHFDMGDIASLCAPRSLLVQSCREDRQNGPRGMENVLPQVETLRTAYRILGAERSMIHEICEGPHRWHGERLEEHLTMLTGNIQ